MGFLWREGRIRMEVVVGLLIVIGTMLEGVEGIKCYREYTKSNIKRTTVDCALLLITSCLKGTDGKDSMRDCGIEFTKDRQQCWIDAYGANGCMDADTSSAANTKYDQCISRENATKTSRDNEEGTLCFCFTDLCNPAGRSAPNAQVIFGILVAASLYAFNIGLGSL